MKLKRFENDINESNAMYFVDKKPELSEENQKLDIIERLSQHWNEKLKNDFLIPRSLYNYTLTELKEIEDYYLNENFGNNYINKFLKEHPEYDNTEFLEYLATNNKDDRDIGELQDVSKEEIIRLSNEWNSVKESKSLWNRHGDKLPSIFKKTIYRLPTDEELEEVNHFNLTANDIDDGFGYTIVGRGMNDSRNKQMILDSIQLLINKYPENTEYQKALDIAKQKPTFNPKMIQALQELKEQHSTNDAVEDIRIENNEIVFDCKCETEIQGVSDYNGIPLRFNKLCSITESVVFDDDKSEEEIIAHARMIKEQCINEYLNEIKKFNNL